MTYGISAFEKVLAFNVSVKAPEDAHLGDVLKGKVSFDTTHADLEIQEVSIKVEALEYLVSPPSAEVAAAGTSDDKPHHITFLDHFRKHGKAPLKLGSVDTHHDHAVLFEQTVHLAEAGTVVQAGHYEYDFELTLPATAPLTNAIPKAGDEVALVLYRYHAQVKIVGATEVGEGYGVLHVIEN